MNPDQVLQTLREAGEALYDGRIIDEPVNLTEETVLLGSESPLDSMAFVAFVTEAEDRLTNLAGREVMLLFDEIHEFNPNKSRLTAGTLANFVAERLLA